MATSKSYSMILNQFEMPLKYEYVQPGIEAMQILNIQNEEEAEKARETFKETPGYDRIPKAFTNNLISKKSHQQALRIVLLADRLKSAQMCAARLSALHNYGGEQSASGNLLACLSFQLLKKHVCGSHPESWIEGSTQIIFGEKAVNESIDDEWVDMLSSIDREERDIFIAFLPGQQNQRLIHRLEFEWGYEVFRIMENDNVYQSVLLAKLLNLQMTPEPDCIQNLMEVVQGLQDYRGEQYSEWDLCQLVKNVAHKGKKTTIGELKKVIGVWNDQKGAGQLALDALIGLDSVKQQVKRMLAVYQLAHRRKVQGEKSIEMHNHLAFAGAPGTCKSVVARLVAQIMQEEGCGTGAFVEAGREDLIGKYLGQTSPKIAQLFEQAKGGVLFIDEIGALQDTENDIYVSEAVNALVRHMELQPDTMVIFATYPEDMKNFLNTNPGLSSRVSRVLEFPSYTMEELWKIFVYLAEKEGFKVPEEGERSTQAYFQTLKDIKAENFGNGREARRLLDACIEELALACLNNTAEDMNGFTAEMLENAQKMLLEQSGR